MGREAYLKIIPKPGKDTSLSQSYCPMSLLHLGGNILFKILADRLTKILPDLIQPSQFGFIKGRSAAANIHNGMAVLEYAKLNQQADMAVEALDVEKAFDSVNIQWLLQTMDHIGVQGTIMTFLGNIYASPTAMVHARESLSKSYALLKGMKHGCPLSPQLFCLALKALPRYLTQTPNLHGVSV